MSHIERSVICLHCKKVHSPGFMWNFSADVRVCFTCFRVMGEEGRKKYERGIVKAEPKKAGYAMKVVVGILATAVVASVVGIYLFGKPIAEQVAVHRAEARGSQLSPER